MQCSEEDCENAAAYLVASVGDVCEPHAFEHEPSTVRYIRNVIGRPDAAVNDDQPDPLADDDPEIRADGGVDGTLLDAVEEELRGRTKDDAITSGELADAVGIDDSNGNPKAREAIRVLLEERGVPVASGNCGYWLLENREQLERYLSDLDGRIQGIQERKQLVESAWDDWGRREATADGGVVVEGDEVSGGDIRRQIKRYVDSHDPAMRDDVSVAVAERLDVTAHLVQLELDKMEKHGFAYIVGDGEVRLP